MIEGHVIPAFLLRTHFVPRLVLEQTHGSGQSLRFSHFPNMYGVVGIVVVVVVVVVVVDSVVDSSVSSVLSRLSTGSGVSKIGSSSSWHFAKARIEMNANMKKAPLLSIILQELNPREFQPASPQFRQNDEISNWAIRRGIWTMLFA